MQSRDFCFWLKGLLEVENISPSALALVKEKLDSVLEELKKTETASPHPSRVVSRPSTDSLGIKLNC